MSFIDWIKNHLSSKEPVQVVCNDLNKDCRDDTPLQIGLYDKNDTPIANTPVFFSIVGKIYEKKTGSDGIATLPIGLNIGEYDYKVEFKGDAKYRSGRNYGKVTVNPILSTSNLTLTHKDGSNFKATVKDIKGIPQSGVNVTFTIGNKDYKKTSDANGIASLPIGLNVGVWNITTTCYNKTEVNTITVKAPPTQSTPPSNNVTYNKKNGVYTSTPHYVGQGCNRLGQCTSYYCAPHSVKQVLSKFNDIDISESTLAGWGGTTTAGTGHSGINTMFKKFNNKYGTKYTIEWINFSSLGATTKERFKKLGELICASNCDCIIHSSYRNKFGHYETIKEINTNNNTVVVLNSLGVKVGKGYKGYLETRSFNTFQSYINNTYGGQPSVALIRSK